MKKSIFLVLFGVIFLFGFSQAAANENWRDLSSINDIIGKWDGYKILEIPQNYDMYLPKTSIEVSVTFEYILGSKDVIGNMKIDMNRFLTDWSNIPEMLFIGFTKDLLWELLLSEIGDFTEFTVGGKYFFNFDLSSDVHRFFETDIYGKIQINGNGTKLRILFLDEVSFGLGDDGFNEIVLDKR